MPIVKSGKVIEDTWQIVDAEQPLPESQPVIMPLTRWQESRDDLGARNAPVGVLLRPADTAEAIADDLDRLPLIALEFPSFRDGRAYSTARILRERYGYTGELRAVGDVLRDQLLFMVRCGIDSVVMDDPNAAETWAVEIERFSVVYQPTADGRPSVPSLRNLRRAAAE